MEVTIYTDASYDRHLKIATCGYCLLVDGKLIKHTVYFAEEVQRVVIAESLAVELALQEAFLMKGVVGIKIYTDHNAIITKKKDRQMWFSELDTIIEIIKEHDIWVRFCHVKAHNGDKYNCLVDLSCKKHLRKLRERISYESNTKGRHRA